MNKVSYYRRRTKIIGTIGPASGDPAVISRLIRAGMDMVRLNLAHGTLEEHSRYIAAIREIGKRTGRRVAILLDLPGPKFRIGRLRGGQAVLKKGGMVSLTEADIEGSDGILPVNLPGLAAGVRVGSDIILDDGALLLKVTDIEGGNVRCRVITGGVLRQGRGLVVPGMRLSVPFITGQLRQGIAFAVRERPDYLALSFVTSAADIEHVKEILREQGASLPLIAKIERGEAVAHFNSILAASDGIMVARGDLGVELELERVPLLQKEFIRKCNRAGKPVITATEMLESMIEETRPTRAETTDVANAIFDGTDAVMLSAETSIGKYPVAAVKMMADIARAAETRLRYDDMLAERRTWLERETDELIAYSACQTAHRLRAAAIVAFTHSGSTAMRVSRYRPSVPIIALTPFDAVCGRLQLYWGVRPHIVGDTATVDDLFATGARMAREIGLAAPGDLVVITAGIPIGEAGTTNMLKVEKVPA